MTQEKINSPMPSMVNYPEPTGSENINEIGFDQTGSRYKVAGGSSGIPKHAAGWRNGETSSTNVQASWTNFNTNTDKISGGAGTYTQVNIKAGSTYKIKGYVGALLNGQTYFKILYQWYDVTQGQFIGSPGGGTGGSSASYSGQGSAPAVAYFTPAVDTTLELRRTSGSWNYMEEGTSFNIEVL